MKKIMHIAALAFVVILMTTCTQQTIVTYPETIKGYWEGFGSEKNKWYGLDITSTTDAFFITYYTEDDPVEQTMSVTYDATTGKGRLSGDGKLINLRATSDSTLALTLVEGTVVFYRGVRPKPVINLVGLWKSNRIDDYGVDLLVYPKDSKGINHITMIYMDDYENEILDATMGTLPKFNQEIGCGSITAGESEGDFHIDANSNPMVMTLDEWKILDEWDTFTKEPKANNMPKSLQGIWVSNQLLASMTITVSADNTLDMFYKATNTEGKEVSGTVKGDLYYSPTAGMGAVVPHNLHEHPALEEFIPPHITCGTFTLSSATEINITFNGIPFKFIKQ